MTLRPILALAAALLLAACYSAPKDEYRVTQSAEIETVVPYGELTFSRLADNVWMHSSHLDLPGIGPIVSNGLLVTSGDHSQLVDTAWTDAQTVQILRFADEILGKPVRAAVITHAHQDKMGGIAALHAAGVDTWAHPLTNRLAPENGFEPARNDLTFWDSGFANGAGRTALYELGIFYPGPAHTRDNLVVGVSSADLVFGGCMIKGSGAETLGNLADADTQAYADSVRRVMVAFNEYFSTVAMSHSAPEGREALERTLELAEAL